MSEPILSARDLSVWYPVSRGVVLPRVVGHIRAVTNVSFSLHAGEILGIVGESGSGKSTLVRTAMLLQPPTGGELRYRGVELFGASTADRLAYQQAVQVVFQHPHSSLDPALRNARIISEPLRARGDGGGGETIATALAAVGLEASVAARLPGALSGGQQQRVALARACSVQPAILFADECVSALDVSVQARILSLLRSLRDEIGFALVFVTHDLAVVRQICDTVLVLKDGRIAEYSDSHSFFAGPSSLYGRSLLEAAARVEPGHA